MEAKGKQKLREGKNKKKPFGFVTMAEDEKAGPGRKRGGRFCILLLKKKSASPNRNETSFPETEKLRASKKTKQDLEILDIFSKFAYLKSRGKLGIFYKVCVEPLHKSKDPVNATVSTKINSIQGTLIQPNSEPSTGNSFCLSY
ncbi:hypothetical protein CEXT_150651 [Caerostris extrusa]|uniref:Uncharacterized protein n=1 Tax=Caerostris extrusa TaxID=172846 RepID=A0AAV4Q8R8_CAEEX|nr:hypothetical protein CEXT_150651 [Caerostris extrusa]